MRKLLYYPALLTIVFSGGLLRSQDIHFSQAFETPLLLSPANTGFYNGYFRAIANYKNQWASMNNAFQTFGVSLDGGLFKSKKRSAFMGMGLTVFSDQAGVAKLRQTVTQLNVSSLVKFSKKSAMSLGFALGAVATNGNYSDLTYESQFNGNTIDPSIVSGEANYRQFTTFDWGTGLAYEYSSFKRDPDHDDITSFKVAFGAYHLNRPEQNFGVNSGYRQPIRLAFSITSVLDLTDTKFTINPAVIFQNQGNYQELLFGSYIKFRKSTGTKITGVKTQNAFGIGLFYRRLDALIPKIICDLGDVSFGFSYDINLSAYRAASMSMGGPEIFLRYNNLASSLFESKKEYK